MLRENSLGTRTTLSVSGAFWNSSFGAVQNALGTFRYRYKKTTESSYGSYINITPTISGDGFSFSANINGDKGSEGFDVSYSYNIQIEIADLIDRTSISQTLTLAAGAPLMSFHRQGVAFGAPYDTSKGGPLQVKGKQIEEYIAARIPQCVGTATLWNQQINGSDVGSSKTLLGCYNHELISPLFDNIRVPSGYHKEYRLFASCQTGNCYVKVGINNIWTTEVMTWSGDTMRKIASTGFFKESDIVLESTYVYSQTPGTNLKIQGRAGDGGSSSAWTVWDIVVCCFIVADGSLNVL